MALAEYSLSLGLFIHLDDLRGGDEVLLEDKQGQAYRYRVSESAVVKPSDGL